MIDTPKAAIDRVQPILAQANLSRMRGRWHAATEACMDALCIQPANVTAHSLMGDIYADQGRLDDAIQWYCMALDLDPESAADRSKLAQTIENRKRELAAKPRRVDLDLVRNALRHRSDDLDRTHFWKSERPIRVFIFAAALICLAIVVAWPIVTARNSHADGDTSNDHKIDTRPIFFSPVSNDSVATDASVVTDESDATLLTHLHQNNELLGRGIQVTDVENDPRSLHLTVTFLNNNTPGGRLIDRPVIMRRGIKLAQLALVAMSPSTATTFTMRALYTSGSGTELAFVGDMTARDITGMNPFDHALTDQDLAAKYGAVWWSAAFPDTPPPAAPRTPGTPPVSAPHAPATSPVSANVNVPAGAAGPEPAGNAPPPPPAFIAPPDVGKGVSPSTPPALPEPVPATPHAAAAKPGGT